jgi:hypothetical protein
MCGSDKMLPKQETLPLLARYLAMIKGTHTARLNIEGSNYSNQQQHAVHGCPVKQLYALGQDEGYIFCGVVQV